MYINAKIKPAKKKPAPIVDDWQGCYPSNWSGVILPESMAHPAKYSSRLIRRIYEHAKAEGWIKTGDKVIDPFGGVALGALDAMRVGLDWTGIELEPRFVELGGMSYQCPGFNSKWWLSLQKETEEKQKEIIQSLRKSFQLCPSCETAIHPKPSRKKAPTKTPERAPHFYRGNIPLWMNRFSSLPNFGTARLLQGDSRRLLQIVKEADLLISSPPYEGTGLDFKDNRMTEGDKVYRRPYMNNQTEDYGATAGQLGSIPSGDFDLSLSSPPYITGGHHNDQTGAYNTNGRGQVQAGQGKETAGYGPTPGQLGQMNPEGFDLSISSPPYAEAIIKRDDPGRGTGQTSINDKRKSVDKNAGNTSLVNYGHEPGQLSVMKSDGFDLSIASPPFLQSTGGTPEPKEGGTIDAALHKRHLAGNKAAEAYGQSDGQLSDMDDHDFNLAVSSPPFLATSGGAHIPKGMEVKDPGLVIRHAADDSGLTAYGDTPGNLANEEIHSFWLAARAIVDQTYAALRPGGHAVWVTKRYVKDKKVVDFSQQWAQLCEAAGFRIIHWHRASLVHHKGTSITFDGQKIEHKTESKSFFRRVYERKGGHRIDWEDVICMVKDK